MSERNDNEVNQILVDESMAPCDWSSISYFLLSCFLFAFGFKITFLSFEEDIRSSNRFWLVGPLFLFSGTLMATNTLIYLKSKNLVELISRQSDFLISENNLNENNNTVYQNLPPSYEAAFNTSTRNDNINTELSNNSISYDVQSNLNNDHTNLIVELPPPAYEDIAK